MKARIIPKADLKKSTEELEAERLLGQLTDDKAIEVMLDGQSARTIRRAFTKAATNQGMIIRLQTKEDRVHVTLKGETAEKPNEAPVAEAINHSTEAPSAVALG